MPILEVEHISKSFNKTPVLKDVGFNLEKGQAVSIIGSSGSGKTTLLRCLNFLEHPDNGIIRVNGETLFDASVPATTQESVIRKKRLHFGLVFQNFNLFPQYTACLLYTSSNGNGAIWYHHKYSAVTDFSLIFISDGVPANSSLPPASPPSGPNSTT